MTDKKVPVTPEAKRTPTGRDRIKFKRYECPYCHDMKGNLKNHVTQKHPVEAAAMASERPVLNKDVLTGAIKPGEVEPTFHPEDVVYYCQDCHAELRKGEEMCWKCEKPLDWSFLNNKEGE